MVEIHEEVELSQSKSVSTNVTNEDEMSYKDLKDRVKNDRIRMQKMKAGHKTKEDHDSDPVCRAQEAILKTMNKIMGVCKAQGFVYGIVSDKGKSVWGSSDSLRTWWQDFVNFEKAAPAAIAEYLPKIIQEAAQELDPNSFMHLLQNLKNNTLGTLLSALMQHCVHPQRQFPLDRGLAPPWWPTGNEVWWGEQGRAQEDGVPPYLKPHDLKKTWKVSVLASIIKHMSPNLDRMRGIVNQSKSLQRKMTAKDTNTLARVFNQEEAFAKLTALSLISRENDEEENVRLVCGGSKSPFDDIGTTSEDIGTTSEGFIVENTTSEDPMESLISGENDEDEDPMESLISGENNEDENARFLCGKRKSTFDDIGTTSDGFIVENRSSEDQLDIWLNTLEEEENQVMKERGTFPESEYNWGDRIIDHSGYENINMDANENANEKELICATSVWDLYEDNMDK